jgi:hypothetical protein
MKMKAIKVLSILIACSLFFACGPADKKQSVSSATAVSSPANSDTRPKEQIAFLNKIHAESDYEIQSDAIKRDAHIAAFNKYALDSLKNIKNWEFKVTEINDSRYQVNSVMQVMSDTYSTPFYNLLLVAPIKIDNSVDSIAINNRVDFTYSTPKTPTNALLKKNLAVVKTLSKGDIVVISGALMHVNDEGKVDFSKFYDETSFVWNFDVMITDIRKKPTQ